jgi:hypothetical protein
MSTSTTAPPSMSWVRRTATTLKRVWHTSIALRHEWRTSIAFLYPVGRAIILSEWACGTPLLRCGRAKGEAPLLALGAGARGDEEDDGDDDLMLMMILVLASGSGRSTLMRRRQEAGRRGASW